MTEDSPNTPDSSTADPPVDNTPAPGPTFDTVNGWYQKWLNRPLTQDEYQQYWAGHTDANESQVFNSPEALALANKNVPNTPQYDPNVPVAPGNDTGQPGSPQYTPPPDPGTVGGTPTAAPPVTNTPPPTIGTTGTPPTSPGTPKTPFGTGIGDFTNPFTEPFNAPTPIATPDAPVFTAPTFGTPDPFKAPTWNAPAPFQAPTPDEAMKDPGYQFTLGQGLQALLNSRAAGGKLNSGETGKALIDYGQAAGSTQYGNVYNRNLNTYETNYQNAADAYKTQYGNALSDYLTNYKTQYQDPYANALQNAQAEFAPKLTEWQTTAPLIQQQNQQAYMNAYNKWLQDYNIYASQQDRAWNKFNSVL